MPSPSLQGDPTATAYHEAGHAVAHYALGRTIRRVTIVPDDDTLGHLRGRVLHDSEKLRSGLFEFDTLKELKAAEDEIVCALCGPIAEARFTGKENEVGASGDYETVAKIVLALHATGDVADAHLAYLEAQAREIVEVLWYLVEALAAKLVTGERSRSRRCSMPPSLPRQGASSRLMVGDGWRGRWGWS
jgi:hypothetical protein